MKCLQCNKEIEAMSSADGFCSADCKARHDENINRLNRWTQYILIILGLMFKWLDHDAYQDLAAASLLKIEGYLEENLNKEWPDRGGGDMVIIPNTAYIKMLLPRNDKKPRWITIEGKRGND